VNIKGCVRRIDGLKHLLEHRAETMYGNFKVLTAAGLMSLVGFKMEKRTAHRSTGCHPSVARTVSDWIWNFSQATFHSQCLQELGLPRLVIVAPHRVLKIFSFICTIKNSIHRPWHRHF